MSTVYDSCTKPVVRAHYDRFVLKGEDFQCAHPALEISVVYGDVDVTLCVAIFGVFDGHGGKSAAQFAAKQVRCCSV